MRRFMLDRKVDVSGVSGVGVVAQGVMFDDGTVVVRWMGETPTTTIYPGIVTVQKINCHNGATVIRWLDMESTDKAWARLVRCDASGLDIRHAKIPAIKMIRQFFGIGLKDAKCLIESWPIAIGELPMDKAEQFKKEMARYGYEVDLM
jgi:hypothetical protein